MSGSTQTIDVLVAVDADYLIANPNALVANAVSMLVNRGAIDSQASGITADGGYELWIDVNPGDNIRWRATTLSRNFDRVALITGVKQTSLPTQGGAISTPTPYNITNIPVPYLDNGAPHGIAKTDVTYTFWQAVAESGGKLSYQITFILLDRNLNQVGEPHTWDPYITVNDR
ncbi:AidA/PixA family protein [Pseudomonas fluorescens]|uniref:Nematocidal protein n=1 Tax=Pseudomonas fluorescens TaxID=294 RepID=A0A944DMK3_PSEFL|nr:AidA/PixA family protein [Pseudomonas fluorescens]MBT2293847.1 nematocidal protein [Pseudomonas fluorescens]MBT2307496.1 nematocidal protein [Pseudomonas fluorescens]MBT2311429.1 nematocidal protein [Pseudomonas fluorescens]MBT2319516.1 nematocidal protein [Pseudomonas fluorescens]MBT2330483.1 nematocidal protein [Pseudomonas fluorescens]